MNGYRETWTNISLFHHRIQNPNNRKKCDCRRARESAREFHKCEFGRVNSREKSVSLLGRRQVHSRKNHTKHQIISSISHSARLQRAKEWIFHAKRGESNSVLRHTLRHSDLLPWNFAMNAWHIHANYGKLNVIQRFLLRWDPDECAWRLRTIVSCPSRRFPNCAIPFGI